MENRVGGAREAACSSVRCAVTKADCIREACYQNSAEAVVFATMIRVLREYEEETTVADAGVTCRVYKRCAREVQAGRVEGDRRRRARRVGGEKTGTARIMVHRSIRLVCFYCPCRSTRSAQRSRPDVRLEHARVFLLPAMQSRREEISRGSRAAVVFSRRAYVRSSACVRC